MNVVKHNPFSAAHFAPGAMPWFEAEPGALAALADRACSGGTHQIIGPHGSGKTTLLIELERQARNRGLRTIRFRGGRMRFKDLRVRGSDLVLLDEAEELGRFGLIALRCFARLSGAGLVLAAHRDLGFATLARPKADSALANRIVQHLLRGSSFSPPTLDDLVVRLERQRGNLREVFFELYDEVERSASV